MILQKLPEKSLEPLGSHKRESFLPFSSWGNIQARTKGTDHSIDMKEENVVLVFRWRGQGKRQSFLFFSDLLVRVIFFFG